MKFIIERASGFTDDNKAPCEGAFQATLTCLFWRKGEQKEAPQTYWVIDSDPITLVNLYESIVLRKSECKEIPIRITIYDDYIE